MQGWLEVELAVFCQLVQPEPSAESE
jgi:hypothetical protein